MTDAAWVGLAAVIAGGVLQGSFMLPMKWNRDWAWENTWLVFSATAYCVCPWLVVLATVPQAFAVFRETPPLEIVLVMVMGLGWGLGALLFGLGVQAIGMGLGVAVIIGVAAAAGTIVPLLSVGACPGLPKLAVTLASLAVMLGGVAVCSLAGRWRETAVVRARSYGAGVLICVASGLLSACGNVGFVIGQPIIERARQAGVAADAASTVVWALLTIALFACNAGSAAVLVARNGTGPRFFGSRAIPEFFGSVLMGVAWIGGFLLYGAGARRLGPLGPSVGWPILMSTTVLTATLIGVASGEWRGAPFQARRQLAVGICLLLAAVAGLGAANAIGE